MDIEKAKKVFEKYINGKDTMKETLIKAIEVLLNELDNKDKEIEYWKEQAEGYQGLAEQIKEDFENRDRWE